MLLFERNVLKKDFGAMLLSARARDRDVPSPAAGLDQISLPALAGGRGRGEDLGRRGSLARVPGPGENNAARAGRSPRGDREARRSRRVVLFVRFHGQAQRNTERPSRYHRSMLAMGTYVRIGGRRAHPYGQWVLLVRQIFAMALGGTLSCGGALVLQSTFDPVEALRLMEVERVTLPVAWPHQWAQLESRPELGNDGFVIAALYRREHAARATSFGQVHVGSSPVGRTAIPRLSPSSPLICTVLRRKWRATLMESHCRARP